MRSRAWLIVCMGFGLAGAVAPLARAQWTDAERKGLDTALFLRNLTQADLNSARPIPPDVREHGVLQDWLSKPGTCTDGLMALHARASADLNQLWTAVSQFQSPHSTVISTLPRVTLPDAVPLPYRGEVSALAAGVARATSVVRSATQRLNPDERRDLIESLPRWFADDPDLNLSFVKRPQIDPRQMRALLARVDLLVIQSAARLLSQQVQEAVPRLKALAARHALEGKIEFEIDGMPVVLAGQGDDRHIRNDVRLLIDLGGEDHYAGRYAAGIGYAAVLIDLSGHDHYAAPDASLGIGLLGIGIGHDASGNDEIHGGAVVAGVGMAGVGVWLDAAGRDELRAANLAGGVAAFGTGLFVDAAGADRRTLVSHGLGSSRTAGVAWCVDLEGDDSYHGSGSGLLGSARGEPEADLFWSGGVGLLTDRAGDDIYNAGANSLAAARDSGVASVFDQKGSDVYRGRGALAGAAGGSIAALFDLDGDDTYVGQGVALAQAFGYAVCLDREGDDVYATTGGPLARAGSHGVALMVEAAGSDHYPQASLTRFRPGATGIGVFTDLAGPDVYAGGLTDGAATIESGRIEFDRESGAIGAPPFEQLPNLQAVPGSRQAPDADGLGRLFAGAAEGELESLKTLLEIGMPALEWMLANRLESAMAAERGVVGWLAERLGEQGRNRVAFLIGSQNDALALQALRVSVERDFDEGGALIVQALERPELRLLAVRAAGQFGAAVAVPHLMRLCLSADPLEVLFALQSLAELGDVQAFGTAQAMLDRPDLLVRQAAIGVLVRAPDQALALAETMLAEPEERRARLGIELLGRLANPAALQRIGGMLLDARAGVRIEALRALEGRFPAEHRPTLGILQRDPDERVRAVALSIDPGR